MRSFVEILCPGNADCGSAIHLFLDGIRFQFGCGDGAQRTAIEAGVKPAKLAAIFVPTLSPCDIGGLPGMLLTAADSGLTRITIAGPVGLRAFLRAARSFFMRPELEIRIEEISDHKVAAQSEQVSIRGIPVPGNGGKENDCAAFLARLADIAGRFDPAKAAALGVPRGRMYGVLQKGISVTLSDGTEVHPSQVMAAATPGPVVAVMPPVSCGAITQIVEAPSFSRAKLETGDRLALIVHLSGKETLLDPRYLAWTRSLGENVRQLALHADFAPERVIFASNVEEIAKLHYTVDESLFPLPHDSTRPHVPSPNPALDPAPALSTHPAATEALSRAWIRADFRLRFLIAPIADAGKVDRSDVPDARVARDPAAPLRPWRNAAPDPAICDTPAPKCAARFAAHGAAVRFLGTGGALPGKHRNVSCIHLHIPARCGVLLDCGEGSYGQLVRALGRDGAREALAQLRVVFISHLHADHHLGLLRILAERARIDATGQVAVIAPRGFSAWLEAALGRDFAQVNFFDARDLTDPKADAARFFADSVGLEIGTVRVLHCPGAFGVVLEDVVEQWKVVYSGDTRPSEALIEAGTDATLLIHEATLDDRLEDEAKAKMHCTTAEALDVAARMGAWRTVLTHFSQRYPKVTALDEKTLAKMKKIGVSVACDLMNVEFRRLEELPRVTEVLRDVYEEAVAELLIHAPVPVGEKAPALLPT